MYFAEPSNIAQSEDFLLFSLFNFFIFVFGFFIVDHLEDEPEDLGTKQYFILFISAGICAGVFIIFLGFLFFR